MRWIRFVVLVLTASVAGAESRLDATLVEEAYKRMQIMVRASHILLALPAAADSEAVAMAMSSASQLKRDIEAGEISFAAVATVRSDDPSVAINDGDLGYFTVFEQPYPVESAAYLTEVGSISAPVRSRFGIHLVLPTARVARSGSKRASHIMLRHEDNARQRIARIRSDATGQNFAGFARRYSEDTRTRGEGGDLGTDRLIDELEAVRLRLDRGQISKPVRSASGWHLLMVTAITPFQSLEQLRGDLIERVQRDPRQRQFPQ